MRSLLFCPYWDAETLSDVRFHVTRDRDPIYPHMVRSILPMISSTFTHSPHPQMHFRDRIGAAHHKDRGKRAQSGVQAEAGGRSGVWRHPFLSFACSVWETSTDIEQGGKLDVLP